MISRRAAAWIILWACGSVRGEFSLGVAAGDVTDRSAILWTRTDAAREVELRLALDSSFDVVERTVAAAATSSSDNTVKLDVDGLSAATRYYYQFFAADEPALVSEIGTFMTAPPADSPAPWSFVFSGDTNYAFAPLGVVASLADEAADEFIWFGDTIYADVPSGGLGVARTLEDYRAKYRQVRGDESMRAALARLSLLVGGDDHEVSNDYAGADPALSVEQRDAAYQAFFEYMPIRAAAADVEPYRTYRRFRRGSLAEFFFLDARQYRETSAAQACGRNPDPYGLFTGALLEDAECQAVLEAQRAFLGREQMEWLKAGLKESDAAWKFIVNNVPMSVLGFAPYDRWDGYDAERRELLEFVDGNGIGGVVVLTTDIHANAYNPDVAGYLESSRGYETAGGVSVPEVIVGPLGNATFSESVNKAATGVLGPLGRVAARTGQNYLARRLKRSVGMSFVETNRVSYVRVDVRSAEEAVVTYVGSRPQVAQDASTPAEAFAEVSLGVTGPTAALPCATPLVASLIGFGLVSRRRSTRLP